MNRQKTRKTSKEKQAVLGSEMAAGEATIFQEPNGITMTASIAPASNGEASAVVVAPHEVFLDIANVQRITGWAWSPGQPLERLSLKIFFDDVEVATITADRFREDLKVAKKGDGYHAFEWIPDPELLPPGGCLVSIRQPGTNAPLTRAKPLILQFDQAPARVAATAAEVVGSIDQAEPYRISGWAFYSHRPTERVVVELLFNGTSLATVRCDGFRQDLKDAGFGDGRHAFTWVPDPSLLQPGSYTIEVRDTGSAGTILAAKTMFYRPSILIDGEVALGANGTFEGWAWNKLRPDEAISVGLFNGDNLLVTALADTFDPKLIAEGVGSGAHAFTLKPPAFFDGEPLVLSIKALPSCVELAGSPVVMPLHVGRHVSLHPTMHSLEPEQTSRTLVEAVTNLSRCTMPPAQVDVDAYRRSCLDALTFLYCADKSAGSAGIVFPEFSEPEISIIIPVYNQFEYTWRCLKSVAVATLGLSFEVIVMDDCSSDETSTLPQRVSGLRYIRQEKNKHYLLNCGQGARAARGKYLYFLNNDTELTPGAIQALLQTFVDFPDAGAVGSKLIYPDGTLQEVGCVIWDNGECHPVGRHERDALLPQYRYLRECHYVTGASMLMPRELFNQVGGFDERYIPAYYEDSDLCMSLRAAGYKVLVQPLSVVIHYEHISTVVAGNRTNVKLQEQNRPKFLGKWGRALAQHPRTSEPWDTLKDVGVRRRCLFFDWRTPRIDEDAGSYAAVQEMRLLQSLGIKVTFASLEMEYAGRHTEALQRLGIECVYAPHFKNWQALLEKRGSEFDFVYGMRFETMEQVIDDMRSRMPHAKILFNPADLHFLRLMREARLKKSVNDPTADELFARADGVKQRELSVMRSSDAIIVYNEIEREVVQTNLPGNLVTVLPFFVPSRDTVPDWSKRAGIAFLGSHQHTPNRDAVEFFARKVMPLIRKSVPDCVFYVYGSDMDLMRKSLEDVQTAGVEVVGSVESVSDAFDRHRVFVAPMRYGSGIKGKVVMAMCNGIPTVLTAVAAEGIHARDQQEVIQAETPAAFAAAVVELHENAARWQSMSNAALHFARTTFSRDRARDVLRATLIGTGITV
jgi:O-antigen biosynthesis protein